MPSRATCDLRVACLGPLEQGDSISRKPWRMSARQATKFMAYMYCIFHRHGRQFELPGTSSFNTCETKEGSANIFSTLIQLNIKAFFQQTTLRETADMTKSTPALCFKRWFKQGSYNRFNARLPQSWASAGGGVGGAKQVFSPPGNWD